LSQWELRSRVARVLELSRASGNPDPYVKISPFLNVGN
jgi:hypothetical protein